MATVNQNPISGGGIQYHVTDGSNMTKVIRVNSEGVALLNRNIDDYQVTSTAIKSYLDTNASSNQTKLQTGVDAILKQAKDRQIADAKTIVERGAGTADIVEQKYTIPLQGDINGPSTVPVSESANIILNSQRADAKTMDEVLGKNKAEVVRSPAREEVEKIKFKDGPLKLNATLGGADLSVFYLSESPVMEDVLDFSLTPDMWRKEIITFEMDNVLSLSYSTIRSKFPVRTLGRTNPKAYTSGPRTIAGHLTFAVMAEDILARLRARIFNAFEKNTSLIKQSISNDSKMRRDPDSFKTIEKIKAYWDVAIKMSGVELLDSLPAFDLLVMGMNDYGLFSRFIIRGIEIIDENQYMGTTQPNIMNKVTFTASDLVPMASFQYNSSSVVSSLGTPLGNVRDNRTGGMVLRGLSASDILEEFDNEAIDSKSVAQLEG